MVTKKIYSAFHALFLICAVIALVSCEKTIDSEELEESKGNLRVSVFQIEKTPFENFTGKAYTPARRAAASEACTRLNFAIYDMAGTRIKQINQQSSAADFGSAVFQLPEGTYQLVVVGHSSGGNPTMTDPTKIQFTNSTGYTDTFLCYGEVTIGEEAVNYQV